MFSRNASYEYHRINYACKDICFKCKHCKKGFTTKTSMNRHITNVCKYSKDNIDNDNNDDSDINDESDSYVDNELITKYHKIG